MQFLPEITFAAEHRLFECFLDAHVYVLPGKQNYCPQPGWFRIIIASDPKQVMEGDYISFFITGTQHIILGKALQLLDDFVVKGSITNF